MKLMLVRTPLIQFQTLPAKMDNCWLIGVRLQNLELKPYVLYWDTNIYCIEMAYNDFRNCLNTFVIFDIVN